MPRPEANIRLSLHSKCQLQALAQRLGLSEGPLVILAIDRLARDEGLRVNELENEDVDKQEAQRMQQGTKPEAV